MKQRRFTLVELLVVITILAILAALLLPALLHAKALARRTVCMNNIDQIMIGSMLYVDDYGRFPSINYNSKDDWLAPNWITYLFQNGGETTNIGHLHDQGYIKSPTTYYCPSNDSPSQHEYYKLSSYLPWPSRGPKNRHIRSSYIYNPHVVEPLSSNRKRRFQMPQQLDPNRAFMFDMVMYPNAIAHVDLSSTKPGWNVAFCDGSVAYSRNREVHDYIMTQDMTKIRLNNYADYAWIIEGLEKNR